MKLTVSKFSEKYIPVRVSWINDVRINHNMHFDLPASVHETQNWFNAVSKATNRIDLIFTDEYDYPLGMAGFAEINLAHSNAEFYIFINPDEHGKGIGKAITKWMLNYGFLKYNLNKIYWYTDSDNLHAVALYEKMCFTKEGIQRRHRFKNGLFRDKVSFGILREEWIRMPWAEAEIHLQFSLN